MEFIIFGLEECLFNVYVKFRGLKALVSKDLFDMIGVFSFIIFHRSLPMAERVETDFGQSRVLKVQG